MNFDFQTKPTPFANLTCINGNGGGSSTPRNNGSSVLGAAQVGKAQAKPEPSIFDTTPPAKGGRNADDSIFFDLPDEM